MQTLKTAAIVVLLMTVMYGAYVSLTTPPEPLPVGVEEMLVISEDGTFSIDAGLPPGLGELEINAGTQTAGFDSAGLDPSGVPGLAALELPESAASVSLG